MLDPKYSKKRQQRLLEVLERRKLDAVVCGSDCHVYYFTAFRPQWIFQSAAVVFADGRSWLTTPNEPAGGAAADRVVCFEAQFLSTLRQEQPAVAAAQVVEVLRSSGVRRIGVDASVVGSQVVLGFDGSVEPIDEDLWEMRRRKDPDELEMMKGAIRCTEAMHARARQIIEPGVPELTVFGELHAAAVAAAGEPLTGILGNDYACGEPGGPARQDRAAAAGELYILDLGPSYRGYRGDNTRTTSVDRKPTQPQLKAWEQVAEALRLFEGMARPGVRCRELFAAVDEYFKHERGYGMSHHLGHGVGLEPHEFPHLNPNWDDELMEGEVISVEPGQYAPDLAAGIRLENQYLVTSTGLQNLVDAPLELA